MTTRVLLIDYNMGNLFSVKNALIKIGAEPIIVDPKTKNIDGVTHAILPGVGAFNDGMKMLHTTGWRSVLKEEIVGKIPLLGICLGMQLFADIGEEGGVGPGLGVIDGSVAKGVAGDGEKSLHVGWNSVEYRVDSPLFSRIPQNTDFYFVHSYHYINTTKSTAIVNYFGRVSAAVVDAGQKIYGVQFHPEKSGEPGLKLLDNFLSIK